MESSSESRKDRYSDINCSEIKYESEKIIDEPVPLLLHPKPPKCTRRLRQMQRTFPSSHELSFHECMFSINNHQARRITQSMNNGDEFLVECSPVVGSGNVVMIPSSIMHDSIEDMAKRMSLKETSLTRLISIKEKRMIKIDKVLDSKNSIFSSSNYSASPTCFSTALVHCVWESNLPFFEFVSDDHRGETFVASPVEIQTAANKSLDYVYIFHLPKISGNLSKKSEKFSDARHVVGKMTVSSSLIVSLDRSKFMETEFILFDANGEQLTEKDTSSLQSKKLSEILPPRSSLKHNPKHKFGESNSEQFEFLPQTINELESLTNGLLPNFESAAIVIRDFGYKLSKDEAYGGWGLKFLEQAPSQSHKERHKDLNVLVPARLHGGPVPLSLIDRWKSGRHCDCGGWDVGCPLTVLKNHSVCSKADKEEDSKPFELFIEVH